MKDVNDKPVQEKYEEIIAEPITPPLPSSLKRNMAKKKLRKELLKNRKAHIRSTRELQAYFSKQQEVILNSVAKFKESGYYELLTGEEQDELDDIADTLKSMSDFIADLGVIANTFETHRNMEKPYKRFLELQPKLANGFVTTGERLNTIMGTYVEPEDQTNIETEGANA